MSFAQSAYDPSVFPDCIFVVNGVGSGGPSTSDTVYCYNISSDSNQTIYSYHDLSVGVFSTNNGAFFGSDGLMYLHTGISTLYTFDVVSLLEAELDNSLGIGTDAGYACMARSPVGSSFDVIYFVSVFPNKFWAYNITTLTSTQGPSPNADGRTFPQCIANGNFLYLFGGDNLFERLNLTAYQNGIDPQWEDINEFDYDSVVCQDGSNLYIDTDTFQVCNRDDKIIIVGNSNDQIGVFDTTDQTLYCATATFPDSSKKSQMSPIVAGLPGNERLYTFGGESSDAIYMSNLLVEPTSAPTAQPTFQPSQVPTNEPSYEPSGLPSVEPSLEPSLEPSVDPSLQPSVEPTTSPGDTQMTNAATDVTVDVSTSNSDQVALTKSKTENSNIVIFFAVGGSLSFLFISMAIYCCCKHFCASAVDIPLTQEHHSSYRPRAQARIKSQQTPGQVEMTPQGRERVQSAESSVLETEEKAGDHGVEGDANQTGAGSLAVTVGVPDLDTDLGAYVTDHHDDHDEAIGGHGEEGMQYTSTGNDGEVHHTDSEHSL